MFGNYTWLILIAVVAIAVIVFFYRRKEGFQDTPQTDPKLFEILKNLLKNYELLTTKMWSENAHVEQIDGKPLIEYLSDTKNEIIELIKKCIPNECTESEIKNPKFIEVYDKVNEIGIFGLPDISFDSLSEPEQ